MILSCCFKPSASLADAMSGGFVRFSSRVTRLWLNRRFSFRGIDSVRLGRHSRLVLRVCLGGVGVDCRCFSYSIASRDAPLRTTKGVGVWLYHAVSLTSSKDQQLVGREERTRARTYLVFLYIAQDYFWLKLCFAIGTERKSMQWPDQGLVNTSQPSHQGSLSSPPPF